MGDSGRLHRIDPRLLRPGSPVAVVGESDHLHRIDPLVSLDQVLLWIWEGWSLFDIGWDPADLAGGT